MSRDNKLKPIYDYIDNGYYKKALIEIDKLLKKTKDVQYVKSLKALCLVRLNKDEEGQIILDELFQCSITDDATLQAMTMAFLDLEQFETIAQLYELALKLEPGNEKLLSHLFMSYVRLQDYSKQKLAAFNLYKVLPKNPYYFWAVMSIYMQAVEMKDQDTANKIILPLAEKMCKKFFDEQRFEAEAEVELYLMILDKQNKISDMIDLIESDIGKTKLKDHLGFVSYRKVGLLKKQGRYSDAFEQLLKLIDNNIDQFNYYIEAFELISQFDCDKSNQILERLWNVTIRNCSPPNIDQSSDNYFQARKSRGPFIAQIIFSFTILKNSKDFLSFLESHPEIKEQNYIENLFKEFFQNFGHKIVCFKDFYFMFKKLSLEKAFIKNLLLQIHDFVIDLEQNNFDDIQRYICYLYLQFYISDVEDNRKFLLENKKQLFEKYLNVQKLLQYDNLKAKEELLTDEIKKKEQQCPFDPIIHLFILYLANGVDLYHDSIIEEFSLDMLSFLEMALKKNELDFYSKLFLVRLYATLGAGNVCFDLFNELEVKHVLLDSLGYQFMQPILTSGCFSQARIFMSKMSQLYKTDRNEQSEYVITCYKYGSFGKIDELRMFFDKLQNSIQHHLFFAERFSIFLMTDCKDNQHFHNLMNESLKIRSKTKWNFILEKTTDNRDMSIYTTNRSLENYVENIKIESKNADFIHVQYRVEFLQAVLSTYYLFNNFCNQNKLLESTETNFTCYSDIDLKFLKQTLINLDMKVLEGRGFCKSHDMKFYFQGPPPTRLFSFMNSCHHELLFPVLNYLENILQYFYHQSDHVEYEIKTDELYQMFKKELSQFNNENSFKSIRKFIEYSSQSLETISFLLLMVEIISSTLANLKPGKKFRKLTQNSSTNNGEMFKNYEREIVGVAKNVKILADFVGELYMALKESLERFDGKYFQWIQKHELNIFTDFEDIVESCKNTKAKLLEAYKQSFSDQITLLNFKLRYLKQLFVYKI